MSFCTPRASLLAGRSTSALQADLAAAQQAYIDLSTGAKGVTYSYSQGDGARAVTYSQANIADLAALIISLQFQLKVPGSGRRPVRFKF